ncbi:MAG: molybdopterin converting factor subunit 1 [Alphaproteobacteria bacterium]|nr:MAG: molybdopterin converting factor subunit 1 [Alphaproteobacteria bacterium]
MIRLVYFAWVRERIGRAEEAFDLPAGVTTVADLCDRLADGSEAHAAAFAERERLRVAVNQDHADWSSPVADGDEVAFFPPVTGG